MGFECDVLDNDTIMALKLGIVGENGFVYVADSGLVGFDAVFLFGVNLWFS